MIRYAVTLEELRERVEQDVPGWSARAKKRTEKFRCKKKYDEKSSIWSEVKPVFMELQGGGKCCFCERKFESGALGRYELDVEHFRPKGNVKECPRGRVGEGIRLTAPPGDRNGYYLLAYHLLNYAVACKPCNSGLKKDYFPIAGDYDLNGEDPAEMGAERPWLLYPIGLLDVDPEEVISFRGIFPQSEHADPNLKQRGLATITFLGLDNVNARKNLLRDRAWIVVLLHGQLAKATDQGDAAARALVKSLLASSAPHANCARSFARLFQEDRAEADAVAEEAEKFLLSRSL